MPPRLSALVVAHNEEARLEACLTALGFADEIVVVLDGCTDGSADIARRHTDQILEGRWPIEGDRRNLGIEACSGDWVLEIDADERVSPDLAAAIRAAIASAPRGWIKIPMANYIGGRRVVHGWGAYNGVGAKPILFSRDAKRWGRQEVHPRLELSGVEQRLDVPLDHFVYRDFADMIDRLNRYSTAHAREMVAAGEIGRLGANLRRVVTRFIKAYWQRRGYKEGMAGLMLGLFAALYPLLSYLKAREMLEARSLRP